MENILNEMNVRFDKFGKYDEPQRNKILALLKIAFSDPDHDYDPNVYDCTYVLTFYYKNLLVGCVCAMDNYDMQKNMSNFVKRRGSMHIDYGKKGCFIYNLAVLKVMRKKKIGSSLVKVLCHYLNRTTDYYHVQIKIDNVGSEKIFLGLNFEKLKTLNNGTFDFNIYIKNIKNEK